MSVTTAIAKRPNPFRALKVRNFRFFWWGQLVSLIGSWMQGLAQGWLILVLADPATRLAVFSHGGDAAAAVHAHVSANAEHTANFYSGLVNFAGGVPILALTLFAGVLADRVNKRKLLLATQTTAMVVALVTGWLIKSQLITIDQLLVLSLILGVSMAADMPVRQSFVPELVPREDLPSAVALNSSMFNAARALGPAISGYLLVRHVSLSDCFFLNGFSYIAVLIGILLMRGKGLGDPKARPATEQKVLENLKAGLKYAWNDHTARNLLILVGGFGMFGFSFNVLIPTFVKYSLLPGASEAAQIRAFGLLETIRGVGALGGAITVAVLSSPARQKTLLIVGGMLASVLLVAFGFVHNMPTAYALMAVVSYGFVMCFATSNTLMQMSVPENLRGRIMSIYVLMFLGTGPIGSLLAGGLAAKFGAPMTIVFFAVISLVIALYACFRPGGISSMKPAAKAPARDVPPTIAETEPEPRMVGGQ